MAMILATTTVITTLLFFNRLFKSRDQSIIGNDKTAILPSVGETNNIYMYIVGTLLNQGKIVHIQIYKEVK